MAAVELCGDARSDHIADKSLLIRVKRLVRHAHIQRCAGAHAAPDQTQRVKQAAQIKRLGGDLRTLALLLEVEEKLHELPAVLFLQRRKLLAEQARHGARQAPRSLPY